MKYLSFLLLVSTLVGAQNVMISNQYYPNEPAIKINPYNPNEMVAAANLNNLYYSHDVLPRKVLRFWWNKKSPFYKFKTD